MITNRSEILFLYDISWANPNGDPVDENKPRIDEETRRNIVTDVRLKRTVRDYLFGSKGKNIFVREIETEDGNLQDAKLRAEDFLYDDNGKKLSKTNLTLGDMKKIINNNLLKDCIDVRLFGATIPVEKNSKEKSSITYTGPVQFKMGYSLHRVKLEYIKGTGAFASGKEQTRKTFREEYVVPYSLLCFYGIINEAAAKHTQLTEDDVNLLLEGLWNGTKNLISRSKAGQMPRLLLKVTYHEPYFYLGELDKGVKLITQLNEEEIRDIDDYRLDFTELVNKLSKYKDKIQLIEFLIDDRFARKSSFLTDLGRLGIEVKPFTI